MDLKFSDAIQSNELITNRDNVFVDGGFLAVKAYNHDGNYHDTYCLMISSFYPSDEDIKTCLREGVKAGKVQAVLNAVNSN